MNFLQPYAEEIVEHRKTKAAMKADKPKSEAAKHREEIRIRLRNKLDDIKDFHTMNDLFF